MLQLSAASQSLVGRWAERTKGLTLKLLNKKKNPPRFIELRLCKMMQNRQPLL